MRTLTNADLADLLCGARILGCGGGGDPERAAELLRGIGEKGVGFASLDGLGKDARLCTVFMIGSSGSRERGGRRLVEAMREFERLVGPVDAIIPVEIGAGAVFEAATLAAERGLPLVDADCVGGRASPEMFLETLTLSGCKRTPLVLVNETEMAILRESGDAGREEEMCRTFACESGGYAYAVGYPLNVENVRRFLVKGSVSRAIDLGRSIRCGKGREWVAAAGGRVLFTGRIAAVEKGEDNGFLIGTVEMDGNAEFAGSRFRVWFKNENLLSWNNGNPAIACPDLLCIVTPEFEGMYNRDLEVGKGVLVLGLPADPLWRSKEGMALFNPKLFGSNMGYKALGGVRL